VGTGHKGVVLGDVCEDGDFCAAYAVLCFLCEFLEGVAEFHDCVHVYTGSGRSEVEESAYSVGFGKGLGDGVHEVRIGGRHTFLDHCTETAEEIDVCFFSGGIEGPCEPDGSLYLARQGLLYLARQGLKQKRSWCYSDSAICNWDAVSLLGGFGEFVEQFSFFDDSPVDAVGEFSVISVHAVF
jgi:hypothetical protein